MNIKQIVIYIALALTTVFSVALVPAVVYADESKDIWAGSKDTQQSCGGVDTAIISCEGDKGEKGLENSGIWSLLEITISILSVGVGVAALGGVVWGAILYTSAGGNPEQVKKAKTIFVNIAIGVVAFAGMFALLNFIVPGGVFD